MADFIIREYIAGDIPSLKAMWAECFGDPEMMVDDFYRILPDMGFGLVCELEGEVCGAAHMIEGMSFENNGHIPCAYLYAVGVFERFRGHGMGSALSKGCKELAKKRGAEIICTQPAKKSLYQWYEDIIDTRHRLCRSAVELESSEGFAEKISAEEYHALRESLLTGTEHMSATKAVIEFEEALCFAYGGALFKTENGIAAAYLEEGACHVKELLTKGDMLKEAAAVGFKLGAAETVLYQASDNAESYVAYDNDKMSPGCIWNISFD